MNGRRLSSFTLAEIHADPSALRSAYEIDGAVVVRGLVDGESRSTFRSTLSELMRQRLADLGRVGRSDDIDALLSALTAVDEQLAMDVIRVTKNSPVFYRAFTDAAILSVVEAMLGSGPVHCVHDVAQFRIDPPDHSLRTFDWHQDYPYNIVSADAVTGWWPLTPVTTDMGPLVLVPGSHRAMLPVRFDDSRHLSGKGTGHSMFEIVGDRDAWESAAIEIDDLAPGDAVFFHCLIVHRSGTNRSTRARWIVNPRYAAAADADCVARGWRTVSDGNTRLFVDLHPDLVRSA